MSQSSAQAVPVQAVPVQAVPVQAIPAQRAATAEAPAKPAAPPAAAPPPQSVAAAPVRARRSLLRSILMLGVPALAIVLGLLYWLSGGREVGTDNAYVGAEKVLVTPQISGPIIAIRVTEGQHVKAGDALFDLDPAPYNVAAALANGRLAAAKIEFENLRAAFTSNEEQIAMGKQAVDVRQADFDRKNELVASKSGTKNDLDTALAALIQARQIQTFVEQQQAATKVKLGGGLDAPIDAFPDYMLAKAGADDAARNLANTHVVAAIDGIATEVAQIQLGRVAAAGQPVFAIVADDKQWIDANPKESDLTYVHVGMPAKVTIDTFPDREFAGKVCSIAPGTGAQFSVLPAQNASGNWVKVVQRIPLRVCFDPSVDTKDLRSGMSAYVAIDTGRVRTLSSLLSGLASWIPGLGAKAASAK
jgi:membrane fusion protein, multidrug efflux system